MELKKSVPLRTELVEVASFKRGVTGNVTAFCSLESSHLFISFHDILHTNVEHLRTLFNGNAGTKHH